MIETNSSVTWMWMRESLVSWVSLFQNWADDRDDATASGNEVADAFDRILTSLTPDTDDDDSLL